MGYDKDVVKEINVTGAVIIKKGESGEDLVLLVQRDSEDHYPLFYEIPRGKCDKGDSKKLIQCLKREVKEETGLDIIPVKFINKFEYIAEKGKRRSIQYNYLCRMKDPNQEVKLSKEHQNFMWVQTVGEIELLCQPEIKRTISKVLNVDTQIVIYPEKDKEILE
jgi:8-oxo-dGTP pyrophosphatase MutT (NUDIX family)